MVEDLTGLTLRELLKLARERLGTGAAVLKTRDELLAALAGQPGAEPVDQDTNSITVLSERSRWASSSSPNSRDSAPVEVVTRDFFRRRSEGG